MEKYNKGSENNESELKSTQLDETILENINNQASSLENEEDNIELEKVLREKREKEIKEQELEIEKQESELEKVREELEQFKNETGKDGKNKGKLLEAEFAEDHNLGKENGSEDIKKTIVEIFNNSTDLNKLLRDLKADMRDMYIEQDKRDIYSKVRSSILKMKFNIQTLENKTEDEKESILKGIIEEFTTIEGLEENTEYINIKNNLESFKPIFEGYTSVAIQNKEEKEIKEQESKSEKVKEELGLHNEENQDNDKKNVIEKIDSINTIIQDIKTKIEQTDEQKKSSLEEALKLFEQIDKLLMSREDLLDSFTSEYDKLEKVLKSLASESQYEETGSEKVKEELGSTNKKESLENLNKTNAEQTGLKKPTLNETIQKTIQKIENKTQSGKKVEEIYRILFEDILIEQGFVKEAYISSQDSTEKNKDIAKSILDFVKENRPDKYQSFTKVSENEKHLEDPLYLLDKLAGVDLPPYRVIKNNESSNDKEKYYKDIILMDITQNQEKVNKKVDNHRESMPLYNQLMGLNIVPLVLIDDRYFDLKNSNKKSRQEAVKLKVDAISNGLKLVLDLEKEERPSYLKLSEIEEYLKLERKQKGLEDKFSSIRKEFKTTKEEIEVSVIEILEGKINKNISDSLLRELKIISPSEGNKNEDKQLLISIINELVTIKSNIHNLLMRVSEINENLTTELIKNVESIIETKFEKLSECKEKIKKLGTDEEIQAKMEAIKESIISRAKSGKKNFQNNLLELELTENQMID